MAASFNSVELFGWNFAKTPMPHATSLTVEGQQVQRGVMQDNLPPHWLADVNVSNLAQSLERAKRLGTIPGQGSMAVLADPTGAAFALWQQAA